MFRGCLETKEAVAAVSAVAAKLVNVDAINMEMGKSAVIIWPVLNISLRKPLCHHLHPLEGAAHFLCGCSDNRLYGRCTELVLY